MRRRVWRWATPATAAALALGLVYGRFLLQARQGVRSARAAVTRGDKVEATRSYLDALRAYVPGSPWERQALDGLGGLAADAAAAGDWEGERRCWDAVRAGLLETRSLYVPYPSRLREANRRLAELASTVPFPPDATVIGQRGYGLARAPSSPGSVIASTLVALAGFALWVGAIVLLIWRGIEDGPSASARAPSVPSLPLVPARWRSSAVVRVLLPLMFVVGFALFLLGLRFG